MYYKNSQYLYICLFLVDIDENVFHKGTILLIIHVCFDNSRQMNAEKGHRYGTPKSQ